MRFSKWHALGNTYLVVDRSEAGALTDRKAQRLCDVSLGVGADGVLEVLEVDGPRAKVLIWNPDGSVAEMSGNGTRIAAAWLAGRSGVAEVVVAVGSREVRAKTLGGLLVETLIDGVDVGGAERVEADGERVEFTPVSVGNPHAVVLGPEVWQREELLRLGPLVEEHSRFPDRTNVQLAHVEGPRDVRVLVWERGAGETSASGSSAVAVAAVVIGQGLCKSPVTVHLPGGELTVRMEGDSAILTGPAEEICRGEIATGVFG
jgi:diaminopimelate epimerase